MGVLPLDPDLPVHNVLHCMHISGSTNKWQGPTSSPTVWCKQFYENSVQLGTNFEIVWNRGGSVSCILKSASCLCRILLSCFLFCCCHSCFVWIFYFCEIFWGEEGLGGGGGGR